MLRVTSSISGRARELNEQGHNRLDEGEKLKRNEKKMKPDPNLSEVNSIKDSPVFTKLNTHAQSFTLKNVVTSSWV